MVQLHRGHDTSSIPAQGDDLTSGHGGENYQISADNTSTYIRNRDARAPQKEDIIINLSEGDLTDQSDKLQSEFNLTENEAQIMYDVFVQLVESMAEEKDKDWSDEATESITNLLISMFIQEQRQQKTLMA